MLNSALAFVARLTIGKHLVAALAWTHNKLDGNRSEIILGVVALVHALKLAGVIPPEAAETAEKVLAGLLPLTLADKASKVMSTIDKVIPALPAKAAPADPAAP